MKQLNPPKVRILRPWNLITLLMLFGLFGCAGRVSGDLKDVPNDVILPSCEETKATYALKYSSDAEDDYGDQTLAGKISSRSFGLIPTFSTLQVHSQVVLLKNNQPIKTLKYTSTVRRYYGILWLFILSPEGVNWLQADEGGGIRVRWGIHDKTISKAVSQLGLNLKSDAVCESSQVDLY